MKYQENQEEYNFNASDKNKFHPHSYVNVCKTISSLNDVETQEFIDGFELDAGIRDEEDLWGVLTSQFSIYEN